MSEELKPCGAADIDRRNSEWRRAILNGDSRFRQAAIARFPLMIMSMARQMNRAIEFRDHGLQNDSLDETIIYLEKRICEVFRSEFGHDLIVGNTRAGE